MIRRSDKLQEETGFLGSLNSKKLKDRVVRLLLSGDWARNIEKLKELPPNRVLRPLLSALHSSDEKIKWAAVTATGMIIASLSEKDMEAARNFVRRFMWSLNDESGNIGWGIPETMGETLARSPSLAEEFGPILVSYIREDGNFLEFEQLQRGAVWALGRLAQVNPSLLQSLGAAHYLLPCLKSRDATIRGLAAWTMGMIGEKDSLFQLESLLRDTAEIKVFRNQKLASSSVCELAKEAGEFIKRKAAEEVEKELTQTNRL